MKTIYWVGCFPPTSHSVGDHAQTLALQKYLPKYFSDYKIKRFYRTELNNFFKENVTKNDLIFIHSSGDFGDLYESHLIRKKIISTYPHIKTVQLPVSVHYRSPSAFEEDKIFFSDKHNLLLLCRSKNDAEMLKGNFNCSVKFFPDFAFYLKPKKLNITRRGCLVVLRNDAESLFRKKVPRTIMRRYVRDIINLILELDFRKRIYRRFPDATICDTQVSDHDITDHNREETINNVFKVFQSFERVVTDRFHACIFSYLTNTSFTTIKSRISEKTNVDVNLNYDEYFKNFREMIFEDNHTEHEDRSQPNSIFDLIKSRRSIRKWINKNVEPNKINTILKSGYYSPTAANTQAVKLKLVDSKSSLNIICKNTSPWFKNSNPSFCVLVSYDLEKANQCGLTKKWHEHFIWQDTACASMNMILMAESLGLKSCWISFNPKQQKDLCRFFGFKNEILTNGVFFGYSNQQVNYEKAIHQKRLIKRKINDIESPI